MIPYLETLDVQLKRPPAEVQRNPFHHQLILRQDRVAGGARFAVARTTRNLSEAVMWQAAVMEFAPDEKTERFLVHRANCEGDHPGRAQTPTDVSPRNWAV